MRRILVIVVPLALFLALYYLYTHTIPDVNEFVSKNEIASNQIFEGNTIAEYKYGVLSWKFVAKKIVYDYSNSTATLEGITGEIFVDGKLVKLRADSGCYLMKQMDVTLKGHVVAEVPADDAKLIADKAQYFGSDKHSEVSGKVLFTKNDIEISGDKAILNADMTDIKVTGHAHAKKKQLSSDTGRLF